MCALASDDVPGLRAFIRSVLNITQARLGYQFAVHELHAAGVVDGSDCTSVRRADEAPGQDIVMESGVWRVCHSDGVSVTAAPLQHRIESVGFVLTEDDTPGRVIIEKIEPILKAHAPGLCQAYGVRTPMALLPSLKSGQSIDLPDGTVLRPEDFLHPKRPGRRLGPFKRHRPRTRSDSLCSQPFSGTPAIRVRSPRWPSAPTC